MYRLIFILLFGLIGISATHLYLIDKSQTLILFTQAENPVISTKDIDEIRTLAQSMKIDFVLKNEANGLPESVTTLPSLYFQNRKGRSRYYGRYKNISRLKNFIRTSKLAHQKDLPNLKKSMLVWKSGRADVTAPIKMTDLSGEIAADFDQKNFRAEAAKSIASGMTKFQLLPEHNLTKNTRSFYFNIYPYLDECDKLTLTTEIYSQYNCVTPVYTKMNAPIASGKWKKRTAIFEEAGRLIEAEIMRQIETSKLGDAFQVVSEAVAVIDWKALNINTDKPAETIVKKQDTSNTKLGQKWQVAPRINDDEPIIIFSFLPPVDNYAGEVKALSGQLTLNDNLSMQDATGKFTVDIADVTMGADDFDNEVQNKMLKMSLFPDAYFEFTAIKGSNTPLQVGQSEQLTVQGTFKMLGISIPIDVDTTIEPFINKKDELRLQVNCTFQLPLFDKFSVKGPDGPSPAKDILQFYMQFELITQ